MTNNTTPPDAAPLTAQELEAIRRPLGLALAHYESRRDNAHNVEEAEELQREVSRLEQIGRLLATIAELQRENAKLTTGRDPATKRRRVDDVLPEEATEYAKALKFELDEYLRSECHDVTVWIGRASAIVEVFGKTNGGATAARCVTAEDNVPPLDPKGELVSRLKRDHCVLQGDRFYFSKLLRWPDWTVLRAKMDSDNVIGEILSASLCETRTTEAPSRAEKALKAARSLEMVAIVQQHAGGRWKFVNAEDDGQIDLCNDGPHPNNPFNYCRLENAPVLRTIKRALDEGATFPELGKWEDS